MAPVASCNVFLGTPLTRELSKVALPWLKLMRSQQQKMSQFHVFTDRNHCVTEEIVNKKVK